MSALKSRTCVALAVGTLFALAACSDDRGDPLGVSTQPEAMMSVGASAPPAPSGLVNVSFGAEDLDLWPYTGQDPYGTIEDPINLIFVGEVDVVSLRAALMSLDGNRTVFGYPDEYPFNCTWTDAHGSYQTSYSSASGWVASAVQLQCGDYSPYRFHIRFFEAGGWVLAGAHFDLLIPNTAEHQVLSWDRPEELVVVDFIRSGLLDPDVPVSFAPLTPPDPVKEIPDAVFAGLPVPFRVFFGLPTSNPSGDPVPIPNDGVATILNVGTRAPVTAGVWESNFTMTYNLAVPRPFCWSGEMDWVLLQGPLQLTTWTEVDDEGMLETHNTLRGELQVTPWDITTWSASGTPFRALISELDNTGVGENGSHVNAVMKRMALPPGVGSLMTHLQTGPNGAAHFLYREVCEL